MDSDNVSRHTGIPMNAYNLMHANELVAVARESDNTVDVRIPEKLPFGLRGLETLNFVLFFKWLNRRLGNLQRSYMNKVCIARKVGCDLELILRDSCALSTTDQFWINRSDVDMTWEKLNELRDQNQTLMEVALYGKTAHLDYAAAKEGTTSLFATKGTFPKFILRDRMRKVFGTQEREWVATVIGNALNLPVQDAAILEPSISNSRNIDGDRLSGGTDDTLVEILLFTSPTVSLSHASDFYFNSPDYSEAARDGQHHRYFYDRLPTETMKRDFEKVLILNWLISNHDMHGENFGCLYDPATFEITGIAPSFDHNSSDFGGTMPELDVPDIVLPNLKHHADVIEKIKAGALHDALTNKTKNWLTAEQKTSVLNVAGELVAAFFLLSPP